MNITLENIDSLRERANVSYAEAKDALEQNEGNMIDAIIYLESEDKTRLNEKVNVNQRKEKYKSNANEFGNGFKKVFKDLNETRVIMYNKKRVILDISMTLTLLATIFFFPSTLCVFVIGLLTNNRFKVTRDDNKSDAINTVLDKAADMSQNVKDKINNVQETTEEENI